MFASLAKAFPSLSHKLALKPLPRKGIATRRKEVQGKGPSGVEVGAGDTPVGHTSSRWWILRVSGQQVEAGVLCEGWDSD